MTILRTLGSSPFPGIIPSSNVEAASAAVTEWTSPLSDGTVPPEGTDLESAAAAAGGSAAALGGTTTSGGTPLGDSVSSDGELGEAGVAGTVPAATATLGNTQAAAAGGAATAGGSPAATAAAGDTTILVGTPSGEDTDTEDGGAEESETGDEDEDEGSSEDGAERRAVGEMKAEEMAVVMVAMEEMEEMAAVVMVVAMVEMAVVEEDKMSKDNNQKMKSETIMIKKISNMNEPTSF
jgi:hypothetical protein